MYDHGGDHLRAELDRLQHVLDRARSRSEAEALVSPDRLRAFAGVSDSDATEFHAELEEMAAGIQSTVAESRENGISLRFDRLARAFDLSRAEKDALLFVLAPEIDRSITTVYGEIGPANTAMLPSVDLVETLLAIAGHGATDAGPDEIHDALAPTSPLFAKNLLTRTSQDSGQPAKYDLLSVDDRIVRYLSGDDSLDPELQDVLTVDQPDTTLDELVFDEETRAALAAIQQRAQTRTDPTLWYLSGEAGTGTERLPNALAAQPILRAAAADIFDSEDLLTILLREARLRDAEIHLTGLEEVTEQSNEAPAASPGADDERPPETAADTPTVDEIVEQLDSAPGDVFLSHTDSWTPDVDLETHHLERCECPFPDQPVLERVWAEYAEEFADPELISHIATNFRLSQRDIRRAVRTARYLARTGTDPADSEIEGVDEDAAESVDAFSPVDGELTREHLYEACKRYSASNLDSLAEQIDPGYAWEDIALNDRQESHLTELAAHLQYRGAVTNEWGFGEPGSRGDGVVALFYGQPGTGKTMAAEVIANETGLDLYRVDLSQVINKYVGETESRLATLLDEAERSNAILLFDEADAIFGKRAEVKDATDRYANMEINFLLQRLESFDGILLLTTNKRSGIDSAFKRRIQHAIGFEKPQERIRRDLWRDAFPEEATVDTDGFDFDFLAQITTTPALIRKVATYAAYIAARDAHDGRPLADAAVDLSTVTIEFEHVIRAIQYAREAGGAGFQVEFGEYDEKRRHYETEAVAQDWREELKRKNARTTLAADSSTENSE